MTARRIEQAAYVAAHRIVEVNTVRSELVCPGARRSRAVDAIAEIIREVFELCIVGDEERTEAEVGPSLRLVNRRRAAEVLQLPPRSYPDEVA